jgi:hypothetical protein
MTFHPFHHMGIWINDKKPQAIADIIGNRGICMLLNKNQYKEKFSYLVGVGIYFSL